MARKRDGLAPVEEAISDLDGPVKELRDASPQAALLDLAGKHGRKP